MKLPSSFWKPTSFEPGETRVWRIGSLSLTIQRGSQDLRIAEERNTDASLEGVESSKLTDQIPEDSRRWVASEGQTLIRLSPQLPDRPVIVRPESPITVPPNQTALFYVGIPMWIQIYCAFKDQEVLLKETPSLLLSNSWFGSSIEGELCYALKTAARLNLQELPPKPYRAICPLQIRNQSSLPLDFERLCLRALHLSLYQRADHCWTSPTRVTYRGEGEWSRLVYGNQGPDHEENLTPLAAPRIPAARGILNRTFDSIRSYAEGQ